jgi:hypothetical protein
VHGLEQRWSDRVTFVYLDIDDPRTDPFKQQLGYRYQPHLFLLDGQGGILQQWIGFVAAEDLDASLRAAVP